MIHKMPTVGSGGGESKEENKNFGEISLKENSSFHWETHKTKYETDSIAIISWGGEAYDDNGIYLDGTPVIIGTPIIGKSYYIYIPQDVELTITGYFQHSLWSVSWLDS